MVDSDCEVNSLSLSDDDSEKNFIPGQYFHIESELDVNDDEGQNGQEQLGIEPYSTEPLADEEWLESYNKRQKEKKEKLERLKDRFSGKETISNW